MEAPAAIAKEVVRRAGAAKAARVNFDAQFDDVNQIFVPEVLEPVTLNAALRNWDGNRALIYCDETAEQGNAVAALSKLKTPAAILVGPEGGFTVEERTMLKALPYVTAISLGPRIMRADTAAVAILALVQAVMGDWKMGVS